MKKRIFNTLFVALLCLLMASLTVVNCFAEATFDTNSTNYTTSTSLHNYFTDYTYTDVARRLVMYRYTDQLITLVRLELGDNPTFIKFQFIYGHNVKYNLFGSYEKSSDTQQRLMSPNEVWFTTAEDMVIPFSSNWNVKKKESWYNCQPMDNTVLIADNHYCIITEK